MAKKRTPHSSRSITEAIQRRDALKKLGALAICAPTLASIACDDDPEAGDAGMMQSGVEPGPGGNPAGMLDAGGGTTGGGTAGGGTAGGGTAGSGTTGGGATGGSTGGTASGEAGVDPVVDAGAGDAGPASAGFFPPMFQDAPMCTLTQVDPAMEGPFFLHEMELMNDTSLNRVDMRDGLPGVELQLNLRLLDASAQCMTPIKDVEVYIWHTDAVGFYSGFGPQNPDEAFVPTPGITTPSKPERFCRGMQVTDANGVASFRTLYPGWYRGRPIHIHFMALRKGSGPAESSYNSSPYHIFTTQMYFDEKFSRDIHENNAPYTTRTTNPNYQEWVKPLASSRVRPNARMEGNVAVASLNIITNSMESRGAPGSGGTGFGGLGGLFGG